MLWIWWPAPDFSQDRVKTCKMWKAKCSYVEQNFHHPSVASCCTEEYHFLFPSCLCLPLMLISSEQWSTVSGVIIFNYLIVLLHYKLIFSNRLMLYVLCHSEGRGMLCLYVKTGCPSEKCLHFYWNTVDK